jgi:hypothetical protein
MPEPMGMTEDDVSAGDHGAARDVIRSRLDVNSTPQ